VSSCSRPGSRLGRIFLLDVIETSSSRTRSVAPCIDTKPKAPRTGVLLLHLDLGGADHLAPAHDLLRWNSRTPPACCRSVRAPGRRAFHDIGLAQCMDDFLFRRDTAAAGVPARTTMPYQLPTLKLGSVSFIAARRPMPSVSSARSSRAVDAAALDERQTGRIGIEDEVHLAAGEVGEGRRAAAIGHVNGLNPRLQVQEFAAQMRQSAIAAGTEEHLTGRVLARSINSLTDFAGTAL